MKALTRNGAGPDDEGLPELAPHLAGNIVYLEALYSAYPGPETAQKSKMRKQLARIEKWLDFYCPVLLAIDQTLVSLNGLKSKCLSIWSQKKSP